MFLVLCHKWGQIFIPLGNERKSQSTLKKFPLPYRDMEGGREEQGRAGSAVLCLFCGYVLGAFREGDILMGILKDLVDVLLLFHYDVDNA